MVPSVLAVNTPPVGAPNTMLVLSIVPLPLTSVSLPTTLMLLIVVTLVIVPPLSALATGAVLVSVSVSTPVPDVWGGVLVLLTL